MGFYNTFVAEIECPTCKQKKNVSGQFKWGALILATYRVGDKLVWDQSEMHLLKDQLTSGLYPDSGLKAGERRDHLLYQCFGVDCSECSQQPGYRPFDVLLEFKADVLKAAYPTLSNDEAKSFLSMLLAGKSTLAVAGAIPDLQEQVARLALFSSALIQHLGQNIQTEHGLTYLRALGTIAIFWAHQMAHPQLTMVRLDSKSVDQALAFVNDHAKHPDYANEAGQILEEVARVTRESESLRKMQA